MWGELYGIFTTAKKLKFCLINKMEWAKMEWRDGMKSEYI